MVGGLSSYELAIISNWLEKRSGQDENLTTFHLSYKSLAIPMFIMEGVILKSFSLVLSSIMDVFCSVYYV